MNNSNVIQFPAPGVQKRHGRNAQNRTPSQDDVFLADLNALLPEDQELWRSMIHVAAKWAKKGIEHRMDIRRAGD
ncbi:MAG TPA: hypothetical protein DCK83_01945 [Gallionellaceae bacterium]|nr:hypothetical protein [Gallionellaceae bacterium]